MSHVNPKFESSLLMAATSRTFNVSHPAPNNSPARPSCPTVVLTAHSIRSLAVIGWRASLLLDAAALLGIDKPLTLFAK